MVCIETGNNKRLGVNHLNYTVRTQQITTSTKCKVGVCCFIHQIMAGCDEISLLERFAQRRESSTLLLSKVAFHFN